MSLNYQQTPPRPGPRTPIIRVLDMHTQTFTVLGKTWLGLVTHWVGRSSALCRNHDEICGWCANDTPKRWRGYLHVYDHQKNEDGFLELTPLSAHTILGQIGEGRPLRGYRLQIRRSNKGKRGTLLITILDPLGEANLPEEKNPEATIVALMSSKSKKGEVTV